jgi:prohibitin 2
MNWQWDLKKGLIAAVIILGLFFALNSTYSIAPGIVGVKVDNITGKTKSVEPGFHFKRPFLDSIYKYSVKTQLSNTKAVGASKDLQEVTLEVQINYRPVYDKVNQIHTNIGQYYFEVVIQPAAFESIKAAIAQYNAEEMMVKREDLRGFIETKLKTNLQQYNIFIETVNIKDIDFRDAFNNAVEEKMIEAQKVKTAEYKMEQARQNKQATILEAEGEAQRQRLLSQAANKDSIALAWISKWNGDIPKVITSDKGGGIFLSLDTK